MSPVLPRPYLYRKLGVLSIRKSERTVALVDTQISTHLKLREIQCVSAIAYVHGQQISVCGGVITTHPNTKLDLSPSLSLSYNFKPLYNDTHICSERREYEMDSACLVFDISLIHKVKKILA